MEPVVNCEEEIGKTVGRRRPKAISEIGFDTKERQREWQRGLPSTGVPKGVYRFKTHEEADQWMIEMRAKTAAERETSSPATHR